MIQNMNEIFGKSETRFVDLLNQRLFESGRKYKFINHVHFTWDEYSVDKSGNTEELIANSKPSGAKCSVSRESGGETLKSTFNFTYEDWTDTDSTTNNLTYNFFNPDSLTFLNTYDNSDGKATSIRLSDGNHTIFATCVSINVGVDELKLFSDTTNLLDDIIPQNSWNDQLTT